MFPRSTYHVKISNHAWEFIGDVNKCERRSTKIKNGSGPSNNREFLVKIVNFPKKLRTWASNVAFSAFFSFSAQVNAWPLRWRLRSHSLPPSAWLFALSAFKALHAKIGLKWKCANSRWSLRSLFD